MSAGEEPLDAQNRALRAELARSRERYRKLASRRSVRAALKLSSVIAPLVRSVRGGSAGAPDSQAGDHPGGQPGGNDRRRLVYEDFDVAAESDTRDTLRAHYESMPDLADRLVSVIMPTYNRALTLPAALESVVSQTHERWELIVVDDGSTDSTEQLLAEYSNDSRVRVVRGDRRGAGAARNAGLDVAVGDVIAFLDSDNRWNSEYLQLMIAAMDADAVDVAYAGMVMVQHGEVVGYRGEPFSYEACLDANFVDLNVLMHVRPQAGGPRFDPALRRLNDWDYLLKLTRDRDVSYVPIVGATYSWQETADQLTLTEPGIYRRIIQYRHGADDSERRDLDAGTILDRIGLRICIRTAIPSEERDAWGDHYFALGLKQALERRGHEVSITFREDPPPERQNVVISLRGLVRHQPVPHSINILWNISHPDLVEFDELEEYDLSFVASETWPNALAVAASTDSHVLHQATDPSMFFPRANLEREGHDVVFVGNSRLADRPIVIAAAQQGLLTSVYGGLWEGTPVEPFVRAQVIPNREVPELYAHASAVLNDHWESMKAFGVISNRIFDGLAAGGAVVSDYLPAISRLFGTAVGMVDEPSDLGESIRSAGRRDQTELVDVGSWTTQHHSFDVRVDSLLEHMRAFAVADDREYGSQVRGRESCAICDARMPQQWPAVVHATDSRSEAGVSRSSVSVGLLGPRGLSDPGCDAVYRRVVQPLLSEFSGPDVRIRGIDVDELDDTAGLDVLVVSLGILDPTEDLAIASSLQASGLPVVVDADRITLSEDAPWQATVACADEIWTSALDVAAVEASIRGDIVHTERGVDPRLLGTYRAPKSTSPPTDFGVIVATRGAHGALSHDAVDALDEIIGQGNVSLIQGTQDETAFVRDSVLRIGGSESDNYPRYARHLRKAAQNADVGLVMADLADGDQQWITDRVDDILVAGIVPIVVMGAGADARPDERCSTSSTADLPQVISQFADGNDSARWLVADSQAHREELLASRAAAVVGGQLAKRLWRIANPEAE